MLTLSLLLSGLPYLIVHASADYNPLNLDLSVHHSPVVLGEQVAEGSVYIPPDATLPDMQAPVDKFHDPDASGKWLEHINTPSPTLVPTVFPTVPPTAIPTVQESCIRCDLTEWSNWTPCSKTCGGGEATRLRHVVNKDPSNMSMDQAAYYLLCDECPYADGDTNTRQSNGCNVEACPFDCILTDWTSWSLSPTANENGRPVFQRRRAIVSHAQNGGVSCPVETSHQRLQEKIWEDWCNEVSDEMDWGECDDSGFQSRHMVRNKCSSKPVEMTDGTKKEVHFQLKLQQKQRCENNAT